MWHRAKSFLQCSIIVLHILPLHALLLAWILPVRNDTHILYVHCWFLVFWLTSVSVVHLWSLQCRCGQQLDSHLCSPSVRTRFVRRGGQSVVTDVISAGKRKRPFICFAVWIKINQLFGDLWLVDCKIVMQFRTITTAGVVKGPFISHSFWLLIFYTVFLMFSWLVIDCGIFLFSVSAALHHLHGRWSTLELTLDLNHTNFFFVYL